MTQRRGRDRSGRRIEQRRSRTAIATIVGCCAGVALLSLVAGAPCAAASIPAWLDEAITKWNGENPSLRIQFVDIKDSYVWYRIQDTPEIGHQEIRDSAYRIVQSHGYATTDDEETVTTARPPALDGPSTAKKCWSRSFLLDIQQLSDTKAVGGEAGGQRQRMLTSLVCEDRTDWFAGFRILN